MAASRYRIVLRGRLSEHFESAFDGMTLEHGPNRTVLVGDVRDQAQLYGLLDRLQEFGIELLAVEPADISDSSSEPGTGLLPGADLGVGPSRWLNLHTKSRSPGARPVAALCPGPGRCTIMTTVRIAHTEPWPGRRVGGRGFGFFSMLVVLADDSGGRALPVWLNGPEGHGLFRGRDDDHAYPGSAEVITAGLLRAAGVTVTGVDIDELDRALTTGPRRGREIAQSTARIEFTAAGTAEPGQMPVRLGYALAVAAATGAPIRVAGQLMDQLAVPAQDDLVGQFTRDVPPPRRRRGLSRLVRGGLVVRQPTR